MEFLAVVFVLHARAGADHVNTDRAFQDGTKLLTCSADKTAKILDVATGTSQATQIAAHDGPISCVKWLDMPSGQGQGVCVTAGWDKMVKVGSPLVYVQH